MRHPKLHSSSTHGIHSKPRRSHSKRWWLILSAVVGVLALAGGAAAYFSLNVGTGSFQVANDPGFSVAVQQASGSPVSPGSGEEDVTVVVTNTSSTTEQLTSLVPTLVTDMAGNVMDMNNGGSVVNGCAASWFDLTYPSVTATLAPGATYAPTSFLQVTMPANAQTSQQNCSGVSPELSFAAA